MKKVAVSVIVPIYNKEKYIEECLNTIVNQTLDSIEIILIDDGSTDSSKQVCEKFLKDYRVSYYYQENEGLASARQTGIEKSHGEFIGFIDADDWIDLDMFEKMYQHAKIHQADVVFCNRMYGNEDYRPAKSIPSGYYDRQRILTEILPKTLAYIGTGGTKCAISWSNCRRIFRRSFLIENDIKFDRRFRRSQDLQLTYESMLHANSFYHMGDDWFYHVRRVSDSLSRGYTTNMWNLYVPLIERLYKDTEEFIEVDLMPAMHLRAFYFVTDCIENEMKTLCPNDTSTRIRLVQEIMDHPICDRYYGQIPIENMNPLYQQYYRLIYEKNAKGIFAAKRRYENKAYRKQKYINPVIGFLSENKVTGYIYKKIRHKKVV